MMTRVCDAGFSRDLIYASTFFTKHAREPYVAHNKLYLMLRTKIRQFYAFLNNQISSTTHRKNVFFSLTYIIASEVVQVLCLK